MVRPALCVLAVLAGSWLGFSAAADSAPDAVSLLGLRGRLPGAWQRVAPSSGYRLAQFVVPAGGDAEAAVFHFEGGGGSAEQNIARWSTQFSAPDGRPVVPRIRRQTVPAGQATTVLFEGTYARGIGATVQDSGRPGQALYATVLDTTRGRLIFQLWGPQATVLGQRAALDGFVAGLAPESGTH